MSSIEQHLLAALDDAVIAGDEHYKTTFWSPSAERLYGWSADEMMGRPAGEVLETTIPGRDLSEVLHALVERGEFRGEVLQTRKDGTKVWVESRAVALREGGRVTGFVAVDRDITNAKLTDLRLRRLSRVFRSAVDPIIITDLDGEIEEVNDAVVAAYGWTRDELVGEPVRKLVPPARHRQSDELLARCRKGEEILNVEGLRWNNAGRTHAALVSLSLLSDDQGEPIGIASIAKDVSDIRWKHLFDSAAIGIATVGTVTDGLRIGLANPALATLLGREPGSLGGVCFGDLVAPDEAVAMARCFAGAAQNGHARCEHQLRRADGTTVAGEITVSTVADRDEPRYHIVTVEDLTERRKLERMLHHAQKMEAVGRLAGGVSHDFNNLLTVIMSFAGFARDALSPSDPARRDVDEVIAAADRASTLTRQLLAFSRKQIVSPKVLSLNTVILDGDAMLRRVIGEDIELVTVPYEGLWNTRIDPSQVEQVLVNLAVNARDAMPAGGKLTIETGNATLDDEYARTRPGVAPGEYVLLAVTDEGIGMDEDVQARLFEPFFTTKAEGKGTGLGLATCYGIVKNVGGNIWVYSEVGRGTTFKVYLPRAAGPRDTLQRRSTSPLPPRGSETILVVEDEPAVRRMAIRTLERLGYNVIEAENGGSALLTCERYDGQIDLLVTDVVMPQMSGHELAKRLALTRPQMKILYMSGYTENAIVYNGVLAPETEFLAKPFMPDVLAQKVRAVLDGGDES